MYYTSSRLNLSSLANNFLRTSYIRLVIFLSISFNFNYFFIFYNDCIFLNILFFSFWEKSNVEREIIGENFGKNEM
jgi:hypothetical protein